MAYQTASSVWEKILEILDEKLQYGLLEQARSVADVRFEGGELALSVVTSEAEEFFNSHINQQRLIIMARAIVPIERVSVTRAPEPSEKK